MVITEPCKGWKDGRHVTQQNNIQHKDTKHINKKRDTQNKDTQHYRIQSFFLLSVSNKPVLLSVIMLTVVFPQRRARDQRSSLFGFEH